MSKFHINDKGEAGQCKAVHGNCPFGDESEHYSTAEDARKAYERFQDGGSWGNVQQDSREMLKKVERGAFVTKDGKLYEVERNWTQEDELDVALVELNEDGFKTNVDYISNDWGETNGYRELSLRQALKIMAANNPNGKAAKALSEGLSVETFKDLAMEGEKLSLATVRPRELYVNNNNRNGNEVYIVSDVIRNKKLEPKSIIVKELRPGGFDGHSATISDESPAHISLETFRKLTPEESERFTSLYAEKSEESLDDQFESYKSYAKKAVADATVKYDEAKMAIASGSYDSQKVGSAMMDYLRAKAAAHDTHIIENPDDYRSMLVHDVEYHDIVAEHRELQYKELKRDKIRNNDLKKAYRENWEATRNYADEARQRLAHFDSTGEIV